MEEEHATFLRYAETTRINSTLFDHTGNGDTHYAVRLNGSESERIGFARSLAVMTGDTIRAEVYAKYLDPDQNNWTVALHDLMAAIAGGTAPTGTVIEAVPPVGGDGFPFAGLLDAAKANDTGTRAYLNILLFDEGLGFLDAAYVPVTTAAKENGTNVPHEKLGGEIVVQQPGYAYIYFSNDNGQPLEVFFDDFTVTHSHSAIVQADDYYPFGMTFNGYRREDSMANKWKFQGQEHIEDLGLNWVSFKWRNHQPDIGRFFNVDPMAEKREWLSPYNFVQNNPILRIDPDGRLDEECDWCEDLIKSLPDMSLEINVTVGAQAGVKIGEVFEADVTVINTEILKDETSIKDGEFNSSKQLGPLKATPEGSVENNGKMTVENSVALKGLGFGGKIGQKQEIDGDLRSSNYKQFSEKGAELGGFGGKIVKETDQGGNSTVKKEGSFSIGVKLLLGVELKLKIGK